MIKQTLILTALVLPLDAAAGCAVDQPEIGDIGPDSEIACRELERRFPQAVLAVENRVIDSPERVRIQATVDGEPFELPYELVRFSWLPAEVEPEPATPALAQDGLSAR